MIVGIGFDVIEIKRIENTLCRFGPRFLARCFTQSEIAFARSRASMAPTLAKRFAAKEACAKALGTGISQGVTWCDIEVLKKTSGAVTIKLHNHAYTLLGRLIPAGFHPQIHLSLSDDLDRAYAYVIISGVPK